jgi:hypothetical protein
VPGAEAADGGELSLECDHLALPSRLIFLSSSIKPIFMPRKSTFNAGLYEGYKVKLVLVRNGLNVYEPIALNSPSDVYLFMKDIVRRQNLSDKFS